MLKLSIEDVYLHEIWLKSIGLVDSYLDEALILFATAFGDTEEQMQDLLNYVSTNKPLKPEIWR